jgi:DNA-binding PadR family transcriptional regulator
VDAGQATGAIDERAETMTRTSLGEFEQQVLLVILRLGREAYSIPIVAELERRTGREVATAAVYVALRRLESKGLLRSRLETPAESGEPYPRRYFAVMEAALEPLKMARRSMMKLWDGLEPLLDD